MEEKINPAKGEGQEIGEEKKTEKSIEEKVNEQNLEEIDPSKIDLVDLIEQPAWKTILIELVKSEKMDVWNIDLAVLADKYLEKIRTLKGRNLKIPANAILASAILLKFKSKALKISSLDDEEEQEKRELTEEEKQEIEDLLPDLTGARKDREGKISLDNLVDSIEKMLDKSKTRVDSRFVKERENLEFQIPMTEINIEELVEKVFDQIKEKADSQGLVVFSNLVEGKNANEIVDIFLPCLFLVNKEKITMWQEKFFGEIMIAINNEKDEQKA